jgi:hypothetical protein
MSVLMKSLPGVNDARPGSGAKPVLPGSDAISGG